MTEPTIRETVHKVLNDLGYPGGGHFGREVEQAIAALEAREGRIAGDLAEQASDYGIPTEDVMRVLIRVGLVPGTTNQMVTLLTEDGERFNLTGDRAAQALRLLAD